MQTIPSVARAAAVALLFAAPVTSAAPGQVVESHRHSLSLPDEVAFRQFLALIQTAPGDPEPTDLRVVARAVGMSADSNGSFEHVRPIAERFQRVRNALLDEEASAIHAHLCTPDRSSRTIEEVGIALNATTDISSALAQKYYQSTIENLAPRQRSAFRKMLNKIKRGTTHTRFDSNTGQEALRVQLEARCMELQDQLVKGRANNEN